MAQLVWTDSRGQTSSFVELDGQRLVEYEHRDWFGLGGLEGRSLIEEEVALGRAASGAERVSASGLPMQVTAARSLAFGARTPW